MNAKAYNKKYIEKGYKFKGSFLYAFDGHFYGLDEIYTCRIKVIVYVST